ncbi:hypothetical protein [Streptomyces anulatus]|uniref:hypothetical protein n=2 Tax=Streptomyces anulatus TaxID=1892 RepID=UPI00053BA0A6|nr:hypothetical protein [Streptomyces anulatus]
MIELLVLIAIAYAGARGVESITNTGDRRLDTKAAEKTVKTVADSSPKGGKSTVKPGPTEPGGTFSAAAPRSATIGGKAAVPLAVLTETSTVMWKAVGEGYRERWPQIREERRQKMAERAAKRKAEKEAAQAEKEAAEAAKAAAEEKRKAEEAEAGPRPPFPPPSDDLPDPAPPAPEPPVVVTEPVEPVSPTRSWDDDWDDWGGDNKYEPVSPIPDPDPAPPAAATVPDPRKPEVMGWPGDDTATVPTPPHPHTPEPQPVPEPAPVPEPPAGTRHLTVVPDTAQNGDSMSAPHAIIPEIRTLDGLMNAFTLIRAMCEMRAEEALAIAADDLTLSNRLDQIEAEMADMEVDDKTRREVDLLRESIRTQSQAAAQYGGRAKDSGDFATAAAQAAYKSHGGIAEAVQSSPIESAAQAGYYER